MAPALGLNKLHRTNGLVADRRRAVQTSRVSCPRCDPDGGYRQCVAIACDLVLFRKAFDNALRWASCWPRSATRREAATPTGTRLQGSLSQYATQSPLLRSPPSQDSLDAIGQLLPKRRRLFSNKHLHLLSIVYKQ